MKVRMTKLAAGPDGVFSPGETYDLPESKARAYIASEAAEPIGDASPPSIELTEISGIGPARADNLREMGIASVGDLAAANWGGIAAEIDGVGIATAKAWVDEAKELI